VSSVTSSIEIAAPPADVWRVALDPWRLEEWVTIHRSIEEAPDAELADGDRIVQTMALRGAPFKVTWTISELEAPVRAVWKGKGPAGSIAETIYELTETKAGTRFDYSNEFKPPGGLIGRVAAGALVGDLPRTEAEASLAKLKDLIQSEHA
jgi:carbon monoxide dehydrogenase subunit G